MILPQSVLEDLQSKSYTGQVMTFKVSIDTPKGKLYTHGGVLEFTAEEGTVQLPYKILRKLELTGEKGVDENMPIVTVECVPLPKGKFAKLEPLDPPKFSQIPDPRARLQAILSAEVCLLEER